MGRDVSLFDRFAPLYERLMPPADPGTLARGLSYADCDLGRVLDVGGGTGRAGRLLDGNVLVVDAAAGMLREARRRGLAGVQADAGRLPFRTESVDAVLVVDALHHFGEPSAAIEDAARVLRPGGVLLLREFDPTTWRGRALVAIERGVGFDSTFFPAGELADLVRDAGLSSFVPDRGFGYTVVGVKRRD